MLASTAATVRRLSHRFNISAILMSSSASSQLLPPTREGVAQAASLITTGQLVAFPTETVYGLGANALNGAACRSIFQAKGRPMTDPLIVHISHPDEATALISGGTSLDMFQNLAKAFWPGPLTMIVKAAEVVPAEVTARTGFVGIRCPNHPLAREFLQACGCPVAAPSANRFGHVSPTLSSHVLDDLAEKGVKVLDGDSKHSQYTCSHGIESTVVRIEDNEDSEKYVTILRQGAVSQEQLEAVVGACNLDSSTDWHVRAIQRQVKMDPLDHTSQEVVGKGEVAPGQSLTHYAPDIPCYAIASIKSVKDGLSGFSLSQSALLDSYCMSNLEFTSHMLMKVILLDFGNQLQAFSSLCLAYKDLSACGSAREAAKNLFSSLRWAETQPNVTHIFIAPITQSKQRENLKYSSLSEEENEKGDNFDVYLGLTDRIFRACSGKSVELEIT